MSNTPVSKIVNVTISSSPTFPARKGFGLLNIIGTSSRLPLSERAQFFTDMDDVALVYSGSDEEYLAAQTAFSQKPRPTEIMISRRLAAAAPGELVGSGFTADLAAWNAIANGAFDITIDGTLRKVNAADFSLVTNMPAVAAIVQTKLNALAAGTTCVFDGRRFIIKSPTTGTASTVSFAVAPTSTGSPVDISHMLGLLVTDGGKIMAGKAIETIPASLDALQQFNSAWYGVQFTKEASEAELKLAMAWVQARVKVLGITSSAANNTDGTSTASLSYYAKQNLYSRTFIIYDDNDPYASVSAIARAFTVDFNAENSTITLKFKTLPGITPTSITETQRLALVANHCNYYTYFGDSAMLAEGVMADGTFFDEVHGLDWFQNAVETNLFGYLYTTTTKVPQTDKGVARLSQRAELACAEGIKNGLFAPGQWNGADLGEVKSGDFLHAGYYVYAQPVALQNQSDREARKAPPIGILAKGAGAIHFADVAVTFER